MKRYRHIDPAGVGAPKCGVPCPGAPYTCTRRAPHGGPHVAHGFPRRIVAVWEAEGSMVVPVASTPKPAKRRRKKEGAPVGLPTRSPGGILQGARDFVVGLFTEWDQLVFVVLFVVIVKLAIDVLMSLY